MDVMYIFISAILAVICFVEAIVLRKKTYALYEMLLNVSFVSFAIYAHAALVKEVDQYVGDRMKNPPCNTSFLQMISAEGTWKGDARFMKLTFNKYGASRVIVYEDFGTSKYGLLHYGFPYDGKKTVALRNCSNPNIPPQN